MRHTFGFIGVAVCVTLLCAVSLTGCGAAQERRVFDAAYDAEDIIVNKLGLEYEHLHMGDLPFYTGANERQVILYANAEDAGLPFDRLWIYPCETETEAAAVLDDVEAWINDAPAPWQDFCIFSRNDDWLRGQRVVGDICPAPDGTLEPWERKTVVPELVEQIVAEQNWDAGSLGEEGYTWWDASVVDVYAHRHETLVLIADKVYYAYVLGEDVQTENHTFAAVDDVQREAELDAFDDFIDNTVNTDAFWE